MNPVDYFLLGSGTDRLPPSDPQFAFSALLSRRRRADSPPGGGNVALRASSQTAGNGVFEVSVARSLAQHYEAERIVATRYGARGYAPALDAFPPVRNGGSKLTLLCHTRGLGVGTMSVRRDDIGSNLHAEDTYPEAVADLRAQGRRLAELCRLALADGADTKVALSTLFGAAYQLGRSQWDTTDVLIEVNPRHVGFYTRLLGFQILANGRECRRVQAPSILLWLQLMRLDEQLASYAPALEHLIPGGFARPHSASL